MQESVEKTRRTWVLALTSLASFMVSLDALVVTTALTTIRRDLGVSIESLEWTVNAYTLSFAVLLIMGAELGDRFGRRRMFITGLALFVGASAACALSCNVGWLIAARAVQGSGAALVTPLALTQVSEAFPPQLRGRAMGIYIGVTGLAVLTGPVLGGAIAQGLAWQWIFWLNVPIGLVLITFTLLRIQESSGPRAPRDIIGLLSVSGASLGIVWALVRGNNAGWGSLEIIATLTAGVLLAAVFVAWESHTRAPMVPMQFFRLRAFSAGIAAHFLLQASLLGSLFFMAQFLQTVQGFGPLSTGVRLLPWTVAVFAVAPLAGTLINHLGERFLVVSGLLLQAAGMASIGLLATPGRAYPLFIAPLVIAGLGVSMALPASQNVVVSAVVPVEIGKASGTFNMFRQLGGAFGVAILAAVFATRGNLGSAQTFSNGFAPAMEISALLSLLGAIVGLVIPGRRKVAARQTSAGKSEPVQQTAS